MLLREGIVRLLNESGHDVVGQLVDADSLLASVSELHPDLVVLDVRLPPTFTDEGIRAAVALRVASPSQPILVLSQYVEERYATELLASDSQGIGYLLKERVADVGDFVDACQRVAAGGTVLDPQVVAQLLARRRRGPFDGLTPREREVLGVDGQRTFECRHRPAPRRFRGGSREAHLLDLFQAGPGHFGHRTPPRARCAAVFTTRLKWGS